MAIKKQSGYTRHHWLKAMKEVAVPVTMTSLVNASMFAIMNLSDIPAIYQTSRVALACIVALYLTVMFSFPAYCYLDLKRQQAGRMDVLFCLKSSVPPDESFKEDFRNTYLYEKFYKPVVLATNKSVRAVIHLFIVVSSLVVMGIGIWGITERDIGLGLEDFFPSDNAAGRWATLRTEQLASWSIGIQWGALDYTDPDTQLQMIKQFEDILATPHVADVETKQLWLADFALWTSRHCDDNFARSDFGKLVCGRDQIFEDGTSCSGAWVSNEYGMREKAFKPVTDDTCLESEGGVCRPLEQMHLADIAELDEGSQNATSFCPVIKDWSDDKWKWCIKEWRNITGVSHFFVVEDQQGSATLCDGVYNKDEDIMWPMPLTKGPSMFAKDLFSHQLTLDMMDETSAVCDDHPDLHCWMTGIPFDYWQQYQGIFEVLMELSGYATLAGFCIAAIFLFARISYEKNHGTGQILIGSVIGAALIAVAIIMTLVSVIGLSILVNVNLTGFSNLAFILSVGFAVEYAVHIVSRWMRCNMSFTTSLERVEHTMSFLMLPTFMSFVSSTIGVICLAFTDFDFNKVFFFRPLMIVMFVSYWFGCWLLPVVLVYLDFDAVKLGKPVPEVLESSKQLSDEDDVGVPMEQPADANPAAGVLATDAEDVIEITEVNT